MQTFIQALVLKHNNDVFLTPDLEIGALKIIPTPGAGGTPDGDFWAVPIADFGIVTGWKFIPTTPDSVVKPDPQAFHVFRLYMTKGLGQDTWYVLGRTTGDLDGSPTEPGYVEVAKAAECCDGDLDIALPLEAPPVVPCQVMCEWDADGNYFAIFGLPSRETGWNLFPYGTLNGNALPAASATGYATNTTLLNFLNAGAWGAIGTWTIVNGVLKVTQDAGSGSDVLCFSVVTINQSA